MRSFFFLSSCPGQVAAQIFKNQWPRTTSCAAFSKSTCPGQLVAQIFSKKYLSRTTRCADFSESSCPGQRVAQIFQRVVVQTTDLWKRIFASNSCRQELTQSFAICGMTRTARVSVLAGVGCFVWFVCVLGGFNSCGILGVLAYNRRNHVVGNKSTGKATTD